MRLKTNFLLIITLFFCSITVNGQLNEIEYFTDSTGRQSSEVLDAIQLEDGVIYSGIIDQNNNSVIPFISRVDTNGTVLWSTLQDSYVSAYNCYRFELVKSEDEYVYGLSYESNATSSNSKFIWKVNKATGNIVYKTSYYYNLFSKMKLFNYDSTYLIVTTAINTGNYHSHIAIIKKSDGDTLKTASYFNFGAGDVNVATDKNKNIIHSIGSMLRKYNGMNLDQLIWENSYDDGPAVDLNEINRIYIDDHNDIYLIGEGGDLFSRWDENGIVKKVDNSNGNELWGARITNSIFSIRITDMVDKNGYLYATFENSSVGSVPYRYHMGKVFKQSGGVAVSNLYYITPSGNPPNSTEQRAYALDVDCNGDVYMNGQYYNSNTSTIQWGIIKANGLNGNKILDKVISNGLTGANNKGKGSTAHAFKNTMIFLGDLNNSVGGSEVSFVKYDTNADTVLIQKTLSNGFKFKSRVVEMVRHNDSLLVLKQEGGKLFVSLYDRYGVEVWTSQLTTNSSKVEIGGNIVTNGNRVYVSSIEYQASSQIPYYSTSPKRLKVNHLDFFNGNSIRTAYMALNSANPELQDIEILNGKAFIFYLDYSYYYSKWNIGGLSTPVSLGNDINANDEGIKNKVFHNDSNLIVFCRNSIKQLNNQMNSPTTIVSFSSGAYLWNDLTSIADTVYVVGKGYSNSNHSILAYDKKNNTILWKKEFSNSNGLRKVKAHNQNLYVAGVNSDHIEVYSLSLDSAKVNWSYQIDSTQYLDADVYDMALISNKNELAVVGGINQTIDAGNGIISLMDLNGTPIQSYKIEGKSGFKTYANRIETFQDSGYWVGGAINRPLFYEEGFIYSLNTKPSLITSLYNVSKQLENKEHSFIVYPNPTSSVLNVKGVQDRVISYSLYDVLGKELMRINQTNQSTIDVNGLSKGTYILIIQSENIREVYRFIKM